MDLSELDIKMSKDSAWVIKQSVRRVGDRGYVAALVFGYPTGKRRIEGKGETAQEAMDDMHQQYMAFEVPE